MSLYLWCEVSAKAKETVCVDGEDKEKLAAGTSCNHPLSPIGLAKLLE
jgi:hypothetical protein